MATKAQLAKAAADLKKAQANLAKATKPAAKPLSVEDTIRSIAASPKTTPTPPAPFQSSVPVTPVNNNIPAPVDPNPSRAVLAPNQYPMAEIVTNAGEKVMIYTSGPLAGQDKNGNYPIQASGTTATLTGGGNTDIANLMSGLGGSSVGDTPNGTATPTKANDLIRAKLKTLKFPDSIIDSSINFIEAALDDGIELSNAVELLYNNKEYTTKSGKKIASPFYAEFTSLGEKYAGDPRFTPTPKELMEFSLGVKSLVSRYGRSSKFAERAALEQYITNGVRITDLDERFATAALKTIEADPNEVKTLKALGYINNTEDLADFYLDPKIGQEQFEINAKTAAFGKQAFKRASYGITFDAARIKQLAATTGNAAEAEATAAQGYETIAQTLQPLTKLEQIYGVGIDQASIQTQLEEEQFRGTASELRKRRKEQEELAFQRRSGTIGASRGSGGSLGNVSTTGIL